MDEGEDMSALFAKIDAVLDGDTDVNRIERTLTDGYARALELEAERWRVERKIAEVARLLVGDDAAGRAAELSALSQRLADADGDLDRLRSRLADLRQHAETVRAA